MHAIVQAEQQLASFETGEEEERETSVDTGEEVEEEVAGGRQVEERVKMEEGEGVKREEVEGVNTESCPNYVGHVPCLQYDFAREGKWRNASAHWNQKAVSKNSRDDDPFCFVQHHADDKEQVHNVLRLMVGSERRRVEKR